MSKVKLCASTAALVLACASSGLAAAQEAPPQTSIASDPNEQVDDIIVYGTGKTRQEQTIDRKAIDILPPGSSPLKAVARLPGVALQSSDPFGSYELGTRLSVRGFNQSQMGYTLDGVPLGDMFYTITTVSTSAARLPRRISRESGGPARYQGEEEAGDHPIKAETVRRIYRMTLNGIDNRGPMGLKSIASWLNDNKVRKCDIGR